MAMAHGKCVLAWDPCGAAARSTCSAPAYGFRSLVVLKVRRQFSLKGASDRGGHAWTSQTNAGSQLIQNGSPVNLLRIFLEELVR